LPVGDENVARAVDVQQADAASLLNHTRAMLALRKAHPALRHGRLEILIADDQRLLFRREADGQSLLCLFNLSGEQAAWPEDIAPTNKLLSAVNGAAPGTLPPFGALIIEE
jgi:alpha-glucosidase